MKRIFSIFSLFLAASILLTSCEDDSKDRFEFGAPGERAGSFAAMTITSAREIDINDLTKTIDGTVDIPSNNVASYSLSVRHLGANTSTGFVEIFSTTSFPASFSISGNDILNALGQTAFDVAPGDFYEFRATSVGTNGEIVNFESLDSDMQSEVGQRQAYFFNAVVICPFVFADIQTGTYNVINLGFAGFFGETSTTRTVNAGTNQLTIVEGEYPSQNSDPLILTLDDAGIVTAVNDTGIAFDGVAQGFPPNTYLLENGTVLSCISLIDLTMNFVPFSANPHPFVLRP